MAVFIKISESFVISNGKDKDLAPEYKKPIVGRTVYDPNHTASTNDIPIPLNLTLLYFPQ